MSFRSTRIHVHNDTGVDLNLVSAEVTSGQWGDDERQRPPATIPGHTTSSFRSESNGFLTGTEGNVRFRIGGPGAQEVYLHWDNPAQGGNSYHQHPGPDFDVVRRGGGGNDATVDFFVRESVLHSTGFLPSRDAFRFTNKWGDAPYSLPPLAGTPLDFKYGNAANGLCGGMVFAARDYFEHGWLIPDGPQPPPGEQDPLFRYLVQRLFDSFDLDSVTLMIKLMDPIYPDTDENPLSALGLASGRAAVMAEIEWPAIRDDIDSGHPSPMTLITIKSLLPTDLGQCHQVLAYAYQVRGEDVELRVYDPNNPHDDVALRFSIRTTADRIVVSHNVDVTDENHLLRPIYCFLRMNYRSTVPSVPTATRPVTNVPPQVWLDVAEQLTGTTVVEHGRKVFPVLDGTCGEAEFDYEIHSQRERVVASVRTRGFVRPVTTWRVAGVDAPAGTRQLAVTVEPTGIDADPTAPAVLTTTTGAATLSIDNRPEDGNFSFLLEAFVTEQTGGALVRTVQAVGFSGTRFVSPDKLDADNACLAKMLDELHQQLPTEAEMVAAILAQLGHPPDPLWDPDPLLQHDAWADLTVSPLVGGELGEVGTFQIGGVDIAEIDTTGLGQMATGPTGDIGQVAVDATGGAALPTGGDLAQGAAAAKVRAVMTATRHLDAVDPEAATRLRAVADTQFRLPPGSR